MLGSTARSRARWKLGRQLGVSRITIRKALDRLEREGAIDCRPGRGTFVRPKQAQAYCGSLLATGSDAAFADRMANFDELNDIIGLPDMLEQSTRYSD